MLLELSPEEARELTDVLANALTGLRNEVDHTDDRAYRRGLRVNADRLGGIRQRLAALCATDPTGPRAEAGSLGSPRK
jgi:hypothetical protein